jgi:short-subunit dehydrogenase
MPSPMASLYSSTKSFITNFACSIAGECVADNIDVIVVHPSPTNTGFYKNAGLLSALKFFQKTAVCPLVCLHSIFHSTGNCRFAF